MRSPSISRTVLRARRQVDLEEIQSLLRLAHLQPEDRFNTQQHLARVHGRSGPGGQEDTVGAVGQVRPSQYAAHQDFILI